MTSASANPTSSRQFELCHFAFTPTREEMKVGIMVQRDLSQEQVEREVTVTIPKKKWIKDYFSFGNFILFG